MTYNWEKIFKSKSDRELYDIFVGKTHLNEEARKFAERELNSRNFNFDNLEKHRKKWELEELVAEERENNKFFGIRTASSKDFLTIGIIGLLFMIIGILNSFLNFLNLSSENQSLSDRVIMIIAGLGFSIFGFIMYRHRKRKEKKKEERVKELIAQL